MLEEVSDYRSNKCRGKTRWINIMRKGQSLLIVILVLRINVGTVFSVCNPVVTEVQTQRCFTRI